MPKALNDEAFSDPLERRAHERKAIEGILPQSLERVHLRAGQYLYRFVDASKLPKHRWTEGAWWVNFETFKRIRELAHAGDSTLGYTARRMLAVCYEYSQVNGVVRALLREPMDALAGRGRWQTDKHPGAKDYVWRPPSDVMQLYIPRLAPMHATLALGGMAFSIIECHSIESGVFA